MAKRIVPTPFPDSPVLTGPADLGRAIRASRTRAGVTLQEAALTLGVSKQTLQALELGEPGVSLGLALKIAQGLGVGLFMAAPERVQEARKRMAAISTPPTDGETDHG